MPFNRFISHLFLMAMFFGVVVLTDGCTIKQQTAPPEPSPEAILFLAQLAESSQMYTAVKGVGRFKIITADRAMSGRLAWIAQRPDRLRLTIIDPGGRPAALLATNGERVWLDLRSEGKHYIKSARRFSLKRLIGIDVTLDDVIEVLLGGIPVRPFHTVEISEPEGLKTARFLSADGGPVSVLKYQSEPFFVTHADYFDHAPEQILGLTRALGSADDEALFPKEFNFQNQTQNQFYLRVDRFWADPEVDSDLFQLDYLNHLPSDDLGDR